MSIKLVKQIDSSNKFDFIKWGVVLLLILSSFVLNYYFIQQPLPLRILVGLVLLCVILFIAFHTVKGRKLWKFFREAKGEIQKVVWPTRKEVFQMTLIVMGIIILFAIFIWGIDVVLMKLMNWFTVQRG